MCRWCTSSTWPIRFFQKFPGLLNWTKLTRWVLLRHRYYSLWLPYNITFISIKKNGVSGLPLWKKTNLCAKMKNELYMNFVKCKFLCHSCISFILLILIVKHIPLSVDSTNPPNNQTSDTLWYYECHVTVYNNY